MSEPERRRRPIWVWLISIFYAVSSVYAFHNLYLALSTMSRISQPAAAYFSGLTEIDYAMTALLLFCNIGGMISLFLLKKQAVPLFFAAFALNVVATVWAIAMRGYFAVFGGPAAISTTIALGLALAVYMYARRLGRREVLR